MTDDFVAVIGLPDREFAARIKRLGGRRVDDFKRMGMLMDARFELGQPIAALPIFTHEVDTHKRGNDE